MKLIKKSLFIIVLSVLLLLTSCGSTDPKDPPVPSEKENTAPVASAGNYQSFANIDESGILVSLNGDNSYDNEDKNNDQLKYSWSMATPPNSEAVLNSTTIKNPTFKADVAGTYTIKLEVTDTSMERDIDTVLVVVANTKPIADAGPNQKIENYGTEIILDGSNSSDDDGDNITYSWEILLKPTDSKAKLIDPENISPTFDGDEIGTYEIQLTVKDRNVFSNSDTVRIMVGEHVVDTGQTESYTNTVGEDSDYNRNSPSYIKLDSAGKELDISATSWSMIKDDVTNLIWENKTNDGTINDANNKYAWQDAQDVFINDLNTGSGFCGHTDWRMPTIKELSSIVNSGTYDPAIDTVYFSNNLVKYLFYIYPWLH